LFPVDDEGKFTLEAGPLFVGKFVLTEGNETVLRELERCGKLLKHEKYVHKYPYDWRTKKPVIVRATKQWFTDLSRIKEDALRAIERVKIIPESGNRNLCVFIIQFLTK
jgi:isoleucyl-tRNA synthetase